MASGAPEHDITDVMGGCSADRSLFDQCIQVRIEVFVHEQGFSLEDEVDDIDQTATHLLLRLIPSKTPIGTLRFYKPAGESYYKLGRLAVIKEYRQCGLGAELVQAGHQYIIVQHMQVGQQLLPALPGPVDVVVHSQLYVKGFYARLGYSPEGEEFDEDGAPHQKMRLWLVS